MHSQNQNQTQGTCPLVQQFIAPFKCGLVVHAELRCTHASRCIAAAGGARAAPGALHGAGRGRAAPSPLQVLTHPSISCFLAPSCTYTRLSPLAAIHRRTHPIPILSYPYRPRRRHRHLLCIPSVAAACSLLYIARSLSQAPLFLDPSLLLLLLCRRHPCHDLVYAVSPSSSPPLCARAVNTTAPPWRPRCSRPARPLLSEGWRVRCLVLYLSVLPHHSIFNFFSSDFPILFPAHRTQQSRR